MHPEWFFFSYQHVHGIERFDFNATQSIFHSAEVSQKKEYGSYPKTPIPHPPKVIYFPPNSIQRLLLHSNTPVDRVLRSREDHPRKGVDLETWRSTLGGIEKTDPGDEISTPRPDLTIATAPDYQRVSDCRVSRRDTTGWEISKSNTQKSGIWFFV
ncbi:hypothetical protein LZ30DRAFT_7841 [Colletotrichum cereale]|nr:hypothetical protein LZ30DRAFT_7841 [Colletotrichum cereale]